MSFQTPLFLLALLLVPLVLLALAAARKRARRYVVRFPATGTVLALGGAVPAWRRALPTALALASIAALALALARPQATVDVPVERASVVLITDASRSMQATDVQPDRLQAAQRAAGSFLDRLPEEVRVGGVAYSDTTTAVQPPSTDHELTRRLVDALVADGGTATGDALTSALDAIQNDRRDDPPGQPSPTAILLLSDGKTTVGSDPVEAARRARELRVPVYTVALGTLEGTLPGSPFQPPLPVPPDRDTLRLMAQVSGGQAFEVEDADALEGIYRRLGSQIGTKPEEREVTAAFAGAGLLLLLGAGLLSARFAGRLP